MLEYKVPTKGYSLVITTWYGWTTRMLPHRLRESAIASAEDAVKGPERGRGPFKEVSVVNVETEETIWAMRRDSENDEWKLVGPEKRDV